MKRILSLLCLTLFFTVPIFFILQQNTANAQYETPPVNINFCYEDYLSLNNYYSDPSKAPEWQENVNKGTFYYYIDSYGQEATVTFTNSNPSVVSFKENSYTFTIPASESWSFETISLDYDIVGVGATTVTVSCGDVVKSLNIYVLPENTTFKKINQTAANEITFYWEPVAGTSGYEILRLPIDADPYAYDNENATPPEVVADLIGDTTTCASIYAKHGVEYQYAIRTYLQADDTRLYGRDCNWPEYRTFSAKKIVPELKPLQITNNTFSLKWKPISGALGYCIYRSTDENGNYSCIAKKTGVESSYSETRKKGITYYYYVTAEYEDGESAPSNSTSGFLPLSGNAKKKNYTKINTIPSLYGMYAGNYAIPEQVSHYVANGTVYTTIAKYPNKLYVYSFDKNLTYKKKKTISLGNFDVYGGCYRGIDGNFYVAVGFNNSKESRTKTVIKVMKFNSSWKLVKTCKIKGNATNVFDGIVEPFRAGSCRMDMKDSMLYIHTARTMFVHSDGLNHQSNITFAIDTKTMKYTCTEDTYSSHSFNQFVKFKDNSIYFTNHGDAYPRTICVETIDAYGTKEQVARETNVLEILGGIGDNFTGTTVGGMEIGSANILVCGTSQPHKDKIKGVTGFSNYGHNVYLAVVNRTTGKFKKIWLTNYNPKNTNIKVWNTRMVKLSDSRFAILYSLTKNAKNTLQYVVVDDTGNVLYKKQYSDYFINGSVQPILQNGFIYWASSTYDTKNYRHFLTMQRIPAVY